jgi:hypothetical protein
MPDGQKSNRRKISEEDRGLAALGFIFAGGFRFGLDADIIGAEGRKARDAFVAVFYFETNPAFITRLIAGIGQCPPVIALPTLRTFTFQHLGRLYSPPTNICQLSLPNFL